MTALVQESGLKADGSQNARQMFDFKKKNGFKRSLELSAEYNLYRQEYCGCGLPEGKMGLSCAPHSYPAGRDLRGKQFELCHRMRGEADRLCEQPIIRRILL